MPVTAHEGPSRFCRRGMWMAVNADKAVLPTFPDRNRYFQRQYCCCSLLRYFFQGSLQRAEGYDDVSVGPLRSVCLGSFATLFTTPAPPDCVPRSSICPVNTTSSKHIKTDPHNRHNGIILQSHQQLLPLHRMLPNWCFGSRSQVANRMQIPAAWVVALAPHAVTLALAKSIDKTAPRTYAKSLESDQTLDKAVRRPSPTFSPSPIPPSLLPSR
jgi:hypothetical protein